MVELLERLGYGAERRRFESRLWSTRDWKTLSVDPVVNGTFFESGKDKAEKDRDWHRLSYVPGIQRDSNPRYPYDLS